MLFPKGRYFKFIIEIMMTSDSVRLIARTNKSIDLGIAHAEKVKDNDHWKLARCFPFNKPLVGNGSL